MQAGLINSPLTCLAIARDGYLHLGVNELWEAQKAYALLSGQK